MAFQRRDFLKLLLSTALAEAVDVEQLLWVPKPIITVPAFGTYGGIERATFSFWRNQALYLDGKGRDSRTLAETGLLDSIVQDLDLYVV